MKSLPSLILQISIIVNLCHYVVVIMEHCRYCPNKLHDNARSKHNFHALTLLQNYYVAQIIWERRLGWDSLPIVLDHYVSVKSIL